MKCISTQVRSSNMSSSVAFFNVASLSMVWPRGNQLECLQAWGRASPRNEAIFRGCRTQGTNTSDQLALAELQKHILLQGKGVEPPGRRLGVNYVSAPGIQVLRGFHNVPIVWDKFLSAFGT